MTKSAMTAIKLLPLPEAGEAMSKWAYHEADMEAYARVCVIHATAAQDAEIERLRAQVRDLEAALEYVKAHKESA